MEGENHYKKGLWTVEEDKILVDYISIHGKGRWNRIAKMTGLKRCGKSCRLRWINYLSPNVKRGDFSEEEDELIIRLHKLLGNRWSLIAGRVPGRTDNQVKNHWNTHLSKKLGIKKETSKARRSTLTRECREVRETPNLPKDSNPMLASVNGDGGTASAKVNKGFQNVGNNCETQESAMSETGLSSFWIFNDNLNQGTLSFLDLLDGYPIDNVWNGL